MLLSFGQIPECFVPGGRVGRCDGQISVIYQWVSFPERQLQHSVWNILHMYEMFIDQFAYVQTIWAQVEFYFLSESREISCNPSFPGLYFVSISKSIGWVLSLYAFFKNISVHVRTDRNSFATCLKQLSSLPSPNGNFHHSFSAFSLPSIVWISFSPHNNPGMDLLTRQCSVFADETSAVLRWSHALGLSS